MHAEGDDLPRDSTRTELAPGVTIPDAALRMQFSRSSGPGGQNVNKLNTRAELWAPISAIAGMNERAIARLRQLAGARLTMRDELHLSAQTERSQEGNRDAVLERLRALVAQSMIEPKSRKKSKPSRAAKARRLESKRRRGEIKARRRGGSGDW